MEGEDRVESTLERLEERGTGLGQAAADHDRLGRQQGDGVRDVEREPVQGALPDLSRLDVATVRPVKNVLRAGDNLAGRLAVAPGDGAGRGNGL